MPAKGSRPSDGTPFGVYVHVPFCSSRCGYCDFNTYVPGEAGQETRSRWYQGAIAEVRRASRIVGDRPVDTVFFGGGTPTLLPAAELVTVLEAIDEAFGLAPGAEVTTEANPETVDAQLLDSLLAGGFNRISIGMQSADPAVLRVLDRQHTPGGAAAAARAAASAGFTRVSLDLIYGTPGESAGSWRGSIEAALEAGVGHVSAYALKVEPGTAMGRRVRAGELQAPDDDQAAASYELADALLTAAGLLWYEISNWARPGHECRHNLGYWRDGDWWGIGPGAHSHLSGRRWWNVRNPNPWLRAVLDERDPVEGAEYLGAPERLTEQVMLGIRLSQGLDLGGIAGGPEATSSTVAELQRDGLVDVRENRIRLTLAGRRLADRVTLSILAALERDPADRR